MIEYVRIHTPWAGSVYWMDARLGGFHVKILVRVLDVRGEKSEVTPVASDNTTFWTLNDELFKRVDGITPPSREEFARN